MARPSIATSAASGRTGFAAVALLLAIMMALPALPAPDEPIGKITAAAHDDAGNLLRGAYLGTLMTLALLTFGAALVAAIRRSDRAGEGWWVLALVGLGATSIGMIADAAVATFVRAVGHSVSGEALWVGYGLDHWLGVLMAAPLGLFVLAASLGARSTGGLPRWQALGGLVVGPLLIVGAGSIAGDEVSGGILGFPLFFGDLLALVWIVAASVSLWREPHAARATAARPVEALS